MHNLTGSDIKITWRQNLNEDANPTLSYYNYAFGQIGNVTWVLGSAIKNETNNIEQLNDIVYYYDLNSLTLHNTNIKTPDTFALWAETAVTVNNEIYYTPDPDQCSSGCDQNNPSFSFWKFNPIDLNFTKLTDIPNGMGVSCYASSLKLDAMRTPNLTVQVNTNDVNIKHDDTNIDKETLGIEDVDFKESKEEIIEPW